MCVRFLLNGSADQSFKHGLQCIIAKRDLLSRISLLMYFLSDCFAPTDLGYLSRVM